MLKEEKKKHKTDHSKNIYKNAYCPTKKTSVTNQISRCVFFLEIQEIGRDLLMMKISYKLTKRTTKTEKFEKNGKMYIINFKTISHKLSPLGNIFHSIFNYQLMRLVSNLGLLKEQKTRKTTNSGKKIEREKCRSH